MGSDAEQERGARALPTPLCAKEGDTFERIVFNDDVPFILHPGGFVYVLLGVVTWVGLHVIDTEDGPTLVSLTRISRNRVYVDSYHASYPSYACNPTELRNIGVVYEMFPTGNPEMRWLVYQEGMAYFPPQEKLHLVPLP